MGFTNFVDTNIFVQEILSYLVSLYSLLFSNCLNQNLHKCLDVKMVTLEFGSTTLS